MKKFFLILFAIIACFNLQGQETLKPVRLPIIDELQYVREGEGTVIVNQDSTITMLHSLRYLQNAKSPGLDGYRIRIFFELGQFARQNSEEVMYKFMEKYPGVPVYQNYQNPYWKISVGDYRTKEEALKFYHEILVEFPKAFIIPERINFPPLN
ncbi:MAG: hypothetical protein PWR03_464 [Tenuifilum sp.]|uniref:hypothetical protein n=1 Tax=Tenuifilum sp. TaxID=2760880 RepID=UPI0024AC1470|nr:hypothetical protein [Tenuifilum sp.]MDI3526281.1 hypothetical protein [Tenuifilum sp.]